MQLNLNWKNWKTIDLFHFTTCSIKLDVFSANKCQNDWDEKQLLLPDEK